MFVLKHLHSTYNFQGLLHEPFPPGGMTCPTQSEQLSPYYFKETAENTSLSSSFDPLSLALSILMLILI